jgi:hypothetical protein
VDIKINGIYRHFKGEKYKVIGVAYHTETLDELVIYESLGDNKKIWARPKKMFFDVIEKNKKRFELIE